MKRISGFCAVVLLGLLAASALHPKAGWIAQQQFAAAFGGQGVHLVEALADAPEVRLPPATDTARSLRRLWGTRIRIERPADQLRAMNPLWPAAGGMPMGGAVMGAGGPPASERTLDAATLRDALALTEQGTRLEPDNGFFPMLKAVALLAARRDGEALAALHEAARKPVWDDGGRAEFLALMDALDRRGPHSVLSDLLIEQSAVEWENPGGAQRFAHVATALAFQRESAGDVVRGMAIRRDLRALGDRIAGQGATPAIRRSGAQMRASAYARPGGASPMNPIFDLLEADLSAAVEGDQALRPEVPTDRFSSLVDSWWWGQFLPGAALTTLLVGAFFGMLAWLPGLRASLPASPGVRLGLWLVLGIGPLGAVCYCLSDVPGAVAVGATALMGLTSFVLWQFAVSLRVRAWLRGLGWAAATVGGTALLPALGIVATWGVTDTHEAFMDCYRTCSSSGWLHNDLAWTTVLQIRSLYAVPALLPLLVLTPLVALVSRIRRVPVTVGVARGLAYCALPVAVLLLFVHALLVVQTGRDEVRLHGALRASIESGSGMSDCALGCGG